MGILRAHPFRPPLTGAPELDTPCALYLMALRRQLNGERERAIARAAAGLVAFGHATLRVTP